MTTKPAAAPLFDNPPVIETVLGLQFAPLNALSSAHVGWFWKQYLDSKWTRVAEVLPLPDQYERFQATAPKQAQVSIQPFPQSPRVQLSWENNGRMIQIQRTQFHYNWNRVAGQYPHYSRGGKRPGNLLTHGCEIDKDKKHRTIALIRPLSQDMPAEDRVTIQNNKKFAFFHLPPTADQFPESYVDCRGLPQWPALGPHPTLLAFGRRAGISILFPYARRPTRSDPASSSDEAVMNSHNLVTMAEPAAHQPLCVRSFGMTDTGKVRPSNQDQFLIAVLLKALQVEQTSLPQAKVQRSSDRSYLFVVADGMGGHAGGEQASALAIDSVETFILGTFKWFAQFKGAEEDQVLTDFQRALGQANARILAEEAERPELHGMGTTLTLAYSLNDVLFVAHVGDSRCYLCRQGSLHRLTRDHTLVEEMVRRGALAPDEVAQHHWRHIITNAVGAGSVDLTVEVHKLQLESGDRVLLCSDGLTGMVPEEEINQVLLSEAQPEQACRRLVTRANEAGGRDNITAVVVYFSS